MNNLLCAAEQSELEELETIIRREVTAFVRVGRALEQIRAKKLYRQSHATFEEYLSARWKLKRQRAYELIAAAKAADGLSEISDISLRESHAAALAPLPAEERADALQEAVETAPEGKLTAKHLKAVVARRLNPGDDQDDDQELTDASSVCPKGGQHEPDKDGDCRKCLEPGVGTKEDAEQDDDTDEDQDDEPDEDSDDDDEPDQDEEDDQESVTTEERDIKKAISSMSRHVSCAISRLNDLNRLFRDEDDKVEELQELLEKARQLIAESETAWHQRAKDEYGSIEDPEGQDDE